jgi:hypothetical protein
MAARRIEGEPAAAPSLRPSGCRAPGRDRRARSPGRALPFSSRTKRIDAVPAGASGRDFAVGEGAVAAGRTVAAARTAGAGRSSWLRYCNVTFSPGWIFAMGGPHGGGPHGTPLRLGTRSRYGTRAPRGAPLHGGRQRQIRDSVPSHGARVLEVRIHLPPAKSLQTIRSAGGKECRQNPLWIRPTDTDFVLEDQFAGLAHSIAVFIPFLVDFSG